MSKKIQNKIILLFGPTASGKSKLAIDIATKFKGEILNADSMQVYKEIKILSARPKKSKIKHHWKLKTKHEINTDAAVGHWTSGRLENYFYLSYVRFSKQFS